MKIIIVIIVKHIFNPFFLMFKGWSVNNSECIALSQEAIKDIDKIANNRPKSIVEKFISYILL